MEEGTAFGPKMVGGNDRISRLDDEWQFILCQLVAVHSSHSEPKSELHTNF